MAETVVIERQALSEVSSSSKLILALRGFSVFISISSSSIFLGESGGESLPKSALLLEMETRR